MIHIAITRHVRKGHEAAFEGELRRFFHDAERHPETLGAYMLRPLAGDRAYGILRSFRDRAAEQSFYASELYRSWNEAVRDHVEGEPEMRELHGLEAFFRQEAPAAAPPRWKMAILTWLAVNPAVYVCSHAVPALLGGLGVPSPLMFGLVNAGVVALLTWVLMPIGVRLAHSLLQPQARAARDGAAD